MDSLRQVGSGLLFGLVCLAIVLGGFALSMTEGGLGAMTAPSLTPGLAPATLVPAISPTLLLETLTPALEPATETPAPPPTQTLIPPPPPTSCPPPAGWVAIVVQIYDTLPGLAQTYHTSADVIRRANCLVSDQLVPGSFIYVPPLPTIACGAPLGWVNYIIQPGDTLSSISLKFRVSVANLQFANCLGSSTYIQAGAILKVPNVPTSTPVRSATPTVTLTLETVTLTPSPTLPSPTTEVPSSTPPPSNTPLPPSNTPQPTPTDAPTNAPSATP